MQNVNITIDNITYTLMADPYRSDKIDHVGHNIWLVYLAGPEEVIAMIDMDDQDKDLPVDCYPWDEEHRYSIHYRPTF